LKEIKLDLDELWQYAWSDKGNWSPSSSVAKAVAHSAHLVQPVIFLAMYPAMYARTSSCHMVELFNKAATMLSTLSSSSANLHSSMTEQLPYNNYVF
jgi:hypothetical protein